MRKSTSAAVVALLLSSSAFAQLPPDTSVLLSNGDMTTVADAEQNGVPEEEITAGVARAEQNSTFRKGILDRSTVSAIDAGKLVHLRLLPTHETGTDCRGPDRYIAHVPGNAQPRCMIFTL